MQMAMVPAVKDTMGRPARKPLPAHLLAQLHAYLPARPPVCMSAHTFTCRLCMAGWAPSLGHACNKCTETTHSVKVVCARAQTHTRVRFCPCVLKLDVLNLSQSAHGAQRVLVLMPFSGALLCISFIFNLHRHGPLGLSYSSASCITGYWRVRSLGESTPRVAYCGECRVWPS